MRRSLLTVLAIALAGGTVLAVPAQAVAPNVELQPERLTRGADVAVPHIEDGDLVDGTRRVELPGTVAEIVGRSGDAWLVATHRTNRVGEWRNRRVVRVEADGSVGDVLRDVDASILVLSEDGSRLVGPTTSDQRTTIKVWSATDGTEIAARRFGGYPEVVAADARRVLVDTIRHTTWWGVGAGRVRTLTTKLTGPASIEHDLLVTYTKDPYLGGCTQVVRLSAPRMKGWRSCQDRVAAFSPDGTQMLTFDILTDGLGPGVIRLRRIDGTTLATYRTNWFSGWEWESPRALLLDVNGQRTFATVRCTLGQCENATDPVKVSAP
jgi:hypothetical protein